MYKLASTAYRNNNRARYRLYLSRLQTPFPFLLTLWQLPSPLTPCLIHLLSMIEVRHLPALLPTFSLTTLLRFFFQTQSQTFLDSSRATLPLTLSMYPVPYVNAELVSKTIAKLKPTFAPGPEGIPSSVLKNYSLCICSATY